MTGSGGLVPSFAPFPVGSAGAGGSGASAPASQDDDRTAKRGPSEVDSERNHGGPRAGRRQVRPVVSAPTARDSAF